MLARLSATVHRFTSFLHSLQWYAVSLFILRAIVAQHLNVLASLKPFAPLDRQAALRLNTLFGAAAPGETDRPAFSPPPHGTLVPKLRSSAIFNICKIPELTPLRETVLRGTPEPGGRHPHRAALPLSSRTSVAHDRGSLAEIQDKSTALPRAAALPVDRFQNTLMRKASRHPTVMSGAIARARQGSAARIEASGA